MTTNPYESPTPQPVSSKHVPSIWKIICAVCLFIAALVLSHPAIVSIYVDSQPVPFRRYATYDYELYLIGIRVSPTTARWVAFTVGPTFLGLGVYLIMSTTRHRQSVVSDRQTDQTGGPSR